VSLYWSYRRPKASASPAWARSTRAIILALSLSAAGRRAGDVPVGAAVWRLLLASRPSVDRRPPTVVPRGDCWSMLSVRA